MENETFKYYAFISYSPQDKKIAKKLQNRLEHYHLPSELQNSSHDLPENLSPIFMDELNIISSGSLQIGLQENLENSNFLIVICSPNSAKSEYVNNEINYFIKLGRRDRIIPLIIDGTPHAKDKSLECFPPAILEIPREFEPLGIDFKTHGTRDSFLRVIATMLGLDLDGFISREDRERKKKIIIFSSIAAVFVIIIGLLIWYNFSLLSEMLYHNTAEYNIAMSYLDKKDYNKAMEWYIKAAHKGLPEAQYYIGYLYEKGLSVPQDYNKAME